MLDHVSIQCSDLTASATPRVRPGYHESYYGAFVRDPDGNNVEAVCHVPG